MNYYVSRGGQQYGPYSLAQLQSMSSQGQVDANDFAWAEGMASWQPVSQVLASASPAPAAQAQPQVQPQQQYTPQPQQQYAPQPQQQQYTPQAQQDFAPQAQYTPQAQSYAPQQQYSPQPYTPQPQSYGAAAAPAAYAQPYTPGYGAQPSAGGPMPPNLHWALVWLIGAVTGGIFNLVWAFIEAGFVKKIDPQSKATKYLVMWLILFPASLIIYMICIAAAVSSQSTALIAFGGLIFFVGAIGGAVVALLGIFDMRRSLVTYYNSVEPIGLRLSGVMTFFFNILYFQYHFSRIATWKTTGQLT